MEKITQYAETLIEKIKEAYLKEVTSVISTKLSKERYEELLESAMTQNSILNAINIDAPESYEELDKIYLNLIKLDEDLKK